MGTLARRALHASIEFNSALNIAQVLLQGGSTQGFGADTTMSFRTAIRRALGVAGSPPQVGLDPAVFAAIRRMGDPDPHLADWLTHGAPLGISGPIPNGNIFPAATAQPTPVGGIEDLTTDLAGWSNYVSAEEDPDACRTVLGRMVHME